MAADVSGLVARVRGQSTLPVALGFGISSPAHVAEACASADAAVVGSALVRVIAEHGKAPDMVERAGEYVRWLKSAV
jgi:tryptophan synthase alpha chain